MEGKRHFDDSCLSNEFLLSSEDTAIQMALVKQCANFSVVGAVPFATFAQTFNRKVGYEATCKKGNQGTPGGPAIKQMKRWVNMYYIFYIAFRHFHAVMKTAFLRFSFVYKFEG